MYARIKVIKNKTAYRLSISLNDADIIFPLPQKEVELCPSGYTVNYLKFRDFEFIVESFIRSQISFLNNLLG